MSRLAAHVEITYTKDPLHERTSTHIVYIDMIPNKGDSISIDGSNQFFRVDNWKIEDDQLKIYCSTENDPEVLTHAISFPNINKIADQLISLHSDKWRQCKEKPNLLGWFVGQAMKMTNGRADPTLLRKTFNERLG